MAQIDGDNNCDTVRTERSEGSLKRAGSMPELIELADTLCEKVGAFGFYHWEGTAKEMFDAAKSYSEARKASNTRI